MHIILKLIWRRYPLFLPGYLVSRSYPSETWHLIFSLSTGMFCPHSLRLQSESFDCQKLEQKPSQCVQKVWFCSPS